MATGQLEAALPTRRYKESIASNLGNIGIIYRNLGKTDEALKHLKEALKINIKIGSNLALVHY